MPSTVLKNRKNNGLIDYDSTLSNSKKIEKDKKQIGLENH